MNESNFKETAEKYREELMKLYGSTPKQSFTPEPKPEPLNPITEDIQSDVQEPPDDLDERFPQPEIPVFMQMSDADTRPHPDPVISFKDGKTNNVSKIRENELPDYYIETPPENDIQTPDETPPSSDPSENKWGFLQVSVRTGNNGIPVPNASITVTRRFDGKEEIVRLTTTDINGNSETLKLSAPPLGVGNQPQDFGHYSVYDIAVFANGFYREVSRNVPIFENIRSLQVFNLIPEPYAFDSGGNYIAYRNQEPEI